MVMLARTASLAACLLLAGTVCLSQEKAAQAPDVDPVERMERLASQIVSLKELRGRARQEGRKEEYEATGKRLRAAIAEERSIIDGLASAMEAAKKAGDAKEATRLERLLSQVASCTSGEKENAAERARAARVLPPDVVFSEVCYWPGEGQDEWVELANVSDHAVDISSWALVDGQALTLRFPDDLAPIPPGGLVLVVFDGKGGVPAWSEGKEKVVVHSAVPCRGDVLGDRGGHLALYALGRHPALADWRALPRQLGTQYQFAPVWRQMRSYVAWGFSPGMMIEDALRTKHWEAQRAVPLGTEPTDAVPVLCEIVRGGSISLVRFRDGERPLPPRWLVMPPSQVTPGAASVLPSPVPVVLFRPTARPDGTVELSCSTIDVPDTQYEFQVSTDREFTDVIWHRVGRNPNSCPRLAPPPQAPVFWRVRAVYPDSSTSPWSESSIVNPATKAAEDRQ